MSLMRHCVRLIQVNDGQHHEQVRLQRNDQDVEHRPRKMQWQLEVTDQRNYQEDHLTGKHVAVETQCQRHRLGQEAWQFQDQVEGQSPFAKRVEGKLAQETTEAFNFYAVENDQEEHAESKTRC